MSTQTIFKTAGSTSQSTELFLVQKAAATSPGDPITGLAYNTSSLTAYYKINGTGTATAITLATQTDTGAYSSGGFVETSSTNAPGCYRFDIPNACLATAGEVTIVFNGAANMATHSVKVICTAIDLYDSVRAGMAALANAAAGASGGLLISGSNSGTTTLGALTVTGATTLTGNVGMAAGLTITQSTTNGHGIVSTGNGTGAGLRVVGGATGVGLNAAGGSTSGNAIATSTTSPNAGIAELGVDMAGTLSGTHSSTTADLGTNAPSKDITGMILRIPSRNFSRLVDSYNTGTGVATFSPSTAETLTNGDIWWLTESAPSSTGNIPKVDVDTIKTNPVVNAGTVTFPAGATLASTTNITAGTITTVTNLTNAPTSGDLTATMKTSVTTAATAATPTVTAGTVTDKTGYRLSSTGVDDVLRTALVESYAADGAAGTLSQILFALQSFLQERAVSGTTLTCKKLDGTTTAMTFTLSDATAPVSVTRAT